jgi:hypothetical protein
MPLLFLLNLLKVVIIYVFVEIIAKNVEIMISFVEIIAKNVEIMISFVVIIAKKRRDYG